MRRFSTLGMLRAGLNAMDEPEEVEEPVEPRRMGAVEAIMTYVLPLSNAARRCAEIEAREEEIHQARLAAIVPQNAPPFRTAKDVATALDVTVTRAKQILADVAPRLKIEHQKGKKWKITEEEFQRIIALKNK
jgi:hypothetical protein